MFLFHRERLTHAARALGTATRACVTQPSDFPGVWEEENERRGRHMALSCLLNLAAARFTLCRPGSEENFPATVLAAGAFSIPQLWLLWLCAYAAALYLLPWRSAK